MFKQSPRCLGEGQCVAYPVKDLICGGPYPFFFIEIVYFVLLPRCFKRGFIQEEFITCRKCGPHVQKKGTRMGNEADRMGVQPVVGVYGRDPDLLVHPLPHVGRINYKYWKLIGN